MMDYNELLKKRRAIRDFEDQGVPLPLVEDILRDATFAPSSSNNQPCRFAVVQCRKAIKNLSDESKACLLQDHSDKKIALNPQYVNLLKDENFNVFYNAPCVIFVAGPKSVGSLDVDAALAAAYIMFAATARGLGTCWVALGANIRDSKLRGELGLSENARIVAPIILGYPKAIPAAPERHAPEILRVITEAR
ncbi:MAG TPA: nitroreductase family protein [Smithellaceae bacterium]|nr:nitroreductase family protein [Smithellaceae bacterium]HRS83225.1 nitroreductase family protein [Smithellaceae bacterium]